MDNKNLQQLLAIHASAKKKMILGIIFTAIAYFLFVIGFSLIYISYVATLIFMLLSMPGFGVGIPFLVIGIINVIKSNRKISLARKNSRPAPQPVQQIPQPQPVPQLVAAPVEVAPVVAAPVEVAPQPVPYEPVRETADTFADMDWQKYNPLDAGISYDKGRDYSFHRADGFVGSVPQKFVDRTFPKCPVCCTREPMWTIAQHNQMSWKGNLYLFKCSHCQSIISMSMPDVTTLGNGAGGVAANPNVGLTNLMVKASSGKEAGAVYAVIESVGISGHSQDCEGKEFKLEDLQDMSLR